MSTYDRRSARELDLWPNDFFLQVADMMRF